MLTTLHNLLVLTPLPFSTFIVSSSYLLLLYSTIIYLPSLKSSCCQKLVAQLFPSFALSGFDCDNSFLTGLQSQPHSIPSEYSCVSYTRSTDEWSCSTSCLSYGLQTEYDDALVIVQCIVQTWLVLSLSTKQCLVCHLLTPISTRGHIITPRVLLFDGSVLVLSWDHWSHTENF